MYFRRLRLNKAISNDLGWAGWTEAKNASVQEVYSCLKVRGIFPFFSPPRNLRSSIRRQSREIADGNDRRTPNEGWIVRNSFKITLGRLKSARRKKRGHRSESGSNPSCWRQSQGRNSLRLVFIFAAFYRCQRSSSSLLILERETLGAHSITLISRLPNMLKKKRKRKERKGKFLSIRSLKFLPDLLANREPSRMKKISDLDVQVYTASSDPVADVCMNHRSVTERGKPALLLVARYSTNAGDSETTLAQILEKIL